MSALTEILPTGQERQLFPGLPCGTSNLEKKADHREPKVHEVRNPVQGLQDKPTKPLTAVELLNRSLIRLNRFTGTHLDGAGDETMTEHAAITKMVAEARALLAP